MNFSKSEALFERAKVVIPGGVNSPVRAFRAVGGKPFFAARANGAYLYDVDDNAFVDYVCTWGPAILGHAPECVKCAVGAALERGTSFGVPGALEVEMAEMVTAWMPSLEMVRMCNSGTEATMSCIRLARGYTGRDKIIKFEGCYHGHVDSLLVKAGSGALTLGHPDSAGIPASLAAETLCLPFNDLPVLEKVLREVGEQVAAVILEPIPANAGLILPQAGFLQELRRLTAKHGIVLIFDEVMTGFRVGKAGVQGLTGITPDLSAFGKVIGGGLPVGAFGGKRAIMEKLAPLGPVYQAGTLSGNPLAMAAGLAQLRELDANDGFVKLEQLGALLESGVRELLAGKKLGYKFYRIGSMWCLFFTDKEVHNLEDAKTADLAAFNKYFHGMLENGVYVPPSQFETCFISLAHGEVEIRKTLTAMERSL
ncbi:MAG: glutamate-1-semialdehyde 2,1-aminomutase [Verrucomicrobiales bacterium]|jgi:glutamate-1-semialdehyde 2,1-aminomutase|nr:glutamate-1-semialdehyde 2,1-aminomutase [Verrucomicrobiales bacterium]